MTWRTPPACRVGTLADTGEHCSPQPGYARRDRKSAVAAR